MKAMIVESPTKVKTLQQMFPDMLIKASIGHIVKISDSGLYNLGIDVKNDFNINFILDDSKKEVVKELKGLVQKADEVYVATDPD